MRTFSLLGLKPEKSFPKLYPPQETIIIVKARDRASAENKSKTLIRQYDLKYPRLFPSDSDNIKPYLKELRSIKSKFKTKSGV